MASHPWRCRVLRAPVLLCLAAASGWASTGSLTAADTGEKRTTTYLDLLYGSGFDDEYYELNTTDERLSTLTIRHWGGRTYWDYFLYGDLYAGDFVDAATGAPREGNIEMFGSGWLRLSLGRVTKTDLAWGPIEDVHLVAAYEHGLGFRAYITGFAVDFDAPGFTFLGGGLYRREDNFSSPTAQVTVWWLRPFPAGRTTISVDGFASAAGTDDVGTDLYSQIQVMVDVGVFGGMKPGRFHTGVEWYYHDTRDQSVSAPQILVKWVW